MDEIKIEKAIEETPEEKTKPSNRNFFIIIATILGVFILIFAGFFIKDQFFTGQVALTIDELHQKNLNGELNEEEAYVYQGFSFLLMDGLWYTRIQNQDKIFEVPLHFGPRDLEDVKITGTLTESFNQGTDIYLTFNPISENIEFITVSSSELAQNIVSAFQRRPIAACDNNETNACSDRPIITCENTNKPVIYLVQEPGPEIELKQNCIILKGVGYDLLKAVDRLVLQWYGVMN